MEETWGVVKRAKAGQRRACHQRNDIGNLPTMAPDDIAQKKPDVLSPSLVVEDGERPLLDRPTLRKQIDEVCSTDADLHEFLTDYFFEIARQFSRGMDRTERITYLLSTADLTKVARKLSDYAATKQRLQIELVAALHRSHKSSRSLPAVPKRHQSRRSGTLFRRTAPSKGDAQRPNKRWKRLKRFLTRLFTVNGISGLLNLVLSRLADYFKVIRYDLMLSGIPVPAMIITAILCLSIFTALFQRCNTPPQSQPANDQHIRQGYPTAPPYGPTEEPSRNSPPK